VEGITIDLYDRVRDGTAPAYVVAEIGINHNGSLDLALAGIDAAAEAGADAVKFQNFKTSDFVTDPSLEIRYTQNRTEVTEQLVDLFGRVEIDTAFLEEIDRHCAARGIDWHSTPTNADGIAALTRLGTNVLKNGSDYLGNLDLIRAMAETGLPLVLSTGMATFADIEEALDAVRKAGNTRAVLLHCTSQYPTPADEVALRRMTRLEQAFGLPVGFSDHTEGSVAAVAAVARGARWIEKHFTADKNLPGPDHAISADPAEFAAYVRDIRAVEAMMRAPGTTLSPREADARRQHRLSCVAAADLPAGHVIARSDILYRRPGTGFAPNRAELLAGLRLARAIKAGEPFTKNHLG
jgi:N,N'-diacetyllegionaminate synthase